MQPNAYQVKFSRKLLVIGILAKQHRGSFLRHPVHLVAACVECLTKKAQTVDT